MSAASLTTSIMGIPTLEYIAYDYGAPRWWWRRIQPTLPSRRMR
jgi:hypothetical protein